MAVFTVGSFGQLHQPAGDCGYFISLGKGPDGPNLSVPRSADDDARCERDAYYSLCKVGQNLIGPALPGQQLLVLPVLHGTLAPRHGLFVNGPEAAMPDDPMALP